MATITPYAGGPLDLNALFTDPKTGQPLTGAARQKAVDAVSKFQQALDSGKKGTLKVGNQTYQYLPSYGPPEIPSFTVGENTFSGVQDIILNRPSSGPGAPPPPPPGTVTYDPVPTVVNPRAAANRAGTIQEQIVRESPNIEAARLGVMASAKALTDQPIDLPEFEVAGLTEGQQALIQEGLGGIGAYQPMVQQAAGSIQQAQARARGASIADVGNVGAQSISGPSLAAAQSGYRPDLQAFQMRGPQDVSAREVQSGIGGLQAFQMGPAERVSTQSFVAPGTAAEYMSPYIQNVLQSQIAEARRADEIARQGRAAQAVAAGAFGGTRQAVQESEAARNLARLEADIMAQGLQGAYTTAQQQFNAEQLARLNAQQANQAAGLTVGQQNLASQLGVQQLGLTTGLQSELANQEAALRAALANQAAGLTTGQQNLASQLATQELGANIGLQTALANLSSEQQANVQRAALDLQARGMNQQAALQAALANQQTQAELSKSRGILDLQASQVMGQQGAALGELGALGQSMQQQGIQFGMGLGEVERGIAQQVLDAKRNTALQEAMEPYQRLGFHSDIVRGTPSAQSTLTVSSAPQPSAAQQAIGFGTSALATAKAGEKVGLF